MWLSLLSWELIANKDKSSSMDFVSTWIVLSQESFSATFCNTTSMNGLLRVSMMIDRSTLLVPLHRSELSLAFIVPKSPVLKKMFKFIAGLSSAYQKSHWRFLEVFVSSGILALFLQRGWPSFRCFCREFFFRPYYSHWQHPSSQILKMMPNVVQYKLLGSFNVGLTLVPSVRGNLKTTTELFTVVVLKVVLVKQWHRYSLGEFSLHAIGCVNRNSHSSPRYQYRT